MNTLVCSHRKVIWYGYSPLRRTKSHTYVATCYRTCFAHRYRPQRALSSWGCNGLDRSLTGKYDSILRSEIDGARFLSPLNYGVREFSLTQRLWENPSSKVEVTVQNMKSKQKEKVDEIMKEASGVAGASATSVGAPIDTPKQVIVKKPLKTRIWEEMVHYYHGFRLLFIDINISRKLLWRVLNGKKLTRRENRLLVQTTSDLFRLIPFSVFIIVPFMELALPIFIKLFPSMLPSTFQTAKEREAKLKQSLQVRLEMARFLQKTLDEMAVQNKDSKSDEAKQFAEFFEKVKNPNEYVPKSEIIKFAKHFDNEFTLDSLSREQVAALCRVLELHTIGTSTFLRFQLRLKLRSLAADDRVIAREGVGALDLFELQQACKARGMRAYGLTEERLRMQLQEWIDLSLNERVPPTLLLLSRALLISDDTTTTEKLKETIRVLPDAVAAHTKAAIGESEGKIDNKAKIEILKNEERKIREELEEEREEKKKAEVLADQTQVIASTDASPVTEPTIAHIPIEKRLALEEAAKAETKITSKDVELLSEALQKVSAEKNTLQVEKERIKDIKEELQDYKDDVEELREVRDVVKEPVHETRAAKLLFKKVNTMINQLDKVLQDLEQKQPKVAGEVATEQGPEQRKQEDFLSIDELVQAIKKLKQTSDESRLKHISIVLSKLDTDKDGAVTVDEVLKVVKAIGRDNVNLDENQMEELLSILNKEQVIQAEEKIVKALEKSKKEAKKAEENKKFEMEVAREQKKDSSAELKDTAPELKDNAKDLSDVPRVRSSDTVTTTKEAVLEAVEKHKEKILPSADITATVPPTIPPPPPTAAQANPKDKRL